MRVKGWRKCGSSNLLLNNVLLVSESTKWEVAATSKGQRKALKKDESMYEST